MRKNKFLLLLALLLTAATGAWAQPATTYSVKMKSGTVDAGNWSIASGENSATGDAADGLTGLSEGDAVTLQYNGRLKVKGVKATSDEEEAEAEADIVWDGTNVTDLYATGTYWPYEKEGITLSGNAEQVDAMWSGSGDPETDGIYFNTHALSGGFTFTAPDGKKFTKIEMTLVSPAGWNEANLGTGWAYNYPTVTWKGSAAASTVGLLTDAVEFHGDKVKYIAFYLSE